MADRAHSERKAGRRRAVIKPEEELDIIDHRAAGKGLRLIRHPIEGHVRPDPELKELLDEIKRQQPATAKADGADKADAA